MKGIIALVLGVFIAFLVGSFLIDEVASDAYTASIDASVVNIGGMSTLLTLLPLLFVLLPIIGVARVLK